MVGSLPKCFDKNEYDVRVVLPKYMCMKEEYKSQTAVHHPFLYGSWMAQPVCGSHWEWIYEGIQFYFIDNEYYFAGTSPTETFTRILKNLHFSQKQLCLMLPVYGFQSGYHPLP